MEASRMIVAENADRLRRFISGYMRDRGIGIQMVEAIAKELFGQEVVQRRGRIPEEAAVAPRQMFDDALKDVVFTGMFIDDTFSDDVFADTSEAADIDYIIRGAASLEFLVRYARMLDPRVMPPHLIPSDEVMDAVLELFHVGRHSR